MHVILISISVLAQAAAAVLAVRLNLRYGRRWAWTLIAAGLFVMTVRRILTLTNFTTDKLAGADTFAFDWELSETATVTTCLASILILVGVAYIEPLFRAIERAEAVLRQRNEDLEATARHNDDELVIARQIQLQLFPELPPEIEGFEIAATSIPAESVGGDCFDYISLPNGEWGLVISDVSGHGIGPAIQMAQCHALLHAIAATVDSPGEMLARTNRLLEPSAPSGRFVTAYVGFLDSRTHRLRYSSAGHIAWILRADRDVPEQLDNNGLVLGILSNSEYAVSQTQLNPGDILVLVTDGATECFAPDGRMFGVHRLFDTIRTHRAESASTILNAVFTAVSEWRGTAGQHDDVTAMIVRAAQIGQQ